MSTQPEALRLAAWMDDMPSVIPGNDSNEWHNAAVELRRLHAANIDCVNHFNALMDERDELLEALKAASNYIDTLGGVSQSYRATIALVRNATLDEIAAKIEAMPFGDTAASFAVWIRGQKV